MTNCGDILLVRSTLQRIIRYSPTPESLFLRTICNAMPETASADTHGDVAHSRRSCNASPTSSIRGRDSFKGRRGSLATVDGDEKDDALVKRRQANAAFEAALAEAVERQVEQANAIPGISPEQVNAVSELLKNASRAMCAAGGALQDADNEIAKKQLRQHDVASKLRMETVRTAAKVALSDKMVEMERRVESLVAKREAAFADDRSAELVEANRRREELEEHVRTLTVHTKSMEEASKLLKEVRAPIPSLASTSSSRG